MEDNNIKIKKGERYMDNIRAILHDMKNGWRWLQGGLWFCKEWQLEDMQAGKSACRRTANALLESMNEIFSFLIFTMELHEDFEDMKLPTLDTKLWVEDGKVIHFEFYQKPMASNLVLQADTALSNSVKTASLKEEVVRRLKYTSLRLDHSKRMETLEDLSQRMSNSGHRPSFMKFVLIGGILRFEMKVKCSLLSKDDPKYKPLFQPSSRDKNRLRKKAMKVIRMNSLKKQKGK